MFAVEQKNRIAVLRMEYGSANALDVDFCLGLAAEVRRLEKSGVRALVLTGTGKIFGAGVDLPKLVEGGAAYARKLLPAIDELLETIFFCPLPIIAAINGHAIAGGCVIACCADRRLLAEGKARVGVPELRAGVPFPTVALEIMRARTASRFEEVVLDGATFETIRALQLGLVDELVEPTALLDKALAAAESLAAIAPASFALSKHQLRQPVREAIDRYRPQHLEQIVAIWESPECLAAVSAYVTKTLGR